MTEPPENRRPLKSRGTGWAQGLASGLAKAGADVAKLDRPWSVGTAGAMTVSVSRVALGALDQAEQTVDCAR